MYFKQILDERCGCASYIIASRESLEAAVVDPALAIEQYRDLLSERGFSLRYVIDTHVHADHVSGARALVAACGGELCLHEAAQTTYPSRGLHDTEDLSLGQLRLHVLHTPGHRPESCSLLVINPPRSPEPSMVLTGDSLLVGDVGRPDFGGGDACQQYDSVNRLLRLPDWVGVFPGHFEGPCGRGMCGRPSTTIGFERLYNPLLHLEREPFISTLTAEVPARPLNMVAIEKTNRGMADMPWAMLTTDLPVTEMRPEDIAQDLGHIVVLDVREPQEYAAGHIAGAMSLPQAELATRLDEVPLDRTVVVVCAAGLRSLRASRFLAQMGYRRVASLTGGTTGWEAQGLPLEREEGQTGAPPALETEWARAGGRVSGGGEAQGTIQLPASLHPADMTG